jgi:MoaA/NifB/PqqE/SkfB family radical SAM enzyme
MEYNDNIKDTWCVNAFHSLCGMNDGTTKPCCMYERDLPHVDYPRFGIDPIKTHMEFHEFQDVQSDMLNGVKHSACRKCWQEEDAGRDSKRIRDNREYFSSGDSYTGITKLELNLGNTCNIKCRTCHPSTSSTWLKEYHKVYWPNEPYKEWIKDWDKFFKYYDDESPFWDDLDKQLYNIKQFDFYGGEPFMSQKMWKLIKTAKDNGYAKNIKLQYNTNSTLWPEEHLRVWEDFEHVFLSFSIDGIGKRFEFMRHPAKWDTCIENFEKAIALRDRNKNMTLNWCITLSNMNIFYLPETLEFFCRNYSDISVYLNLVHGPEYFNISRLPTEIKNYVNEKLIDLKQKDWISDDIASQVDGIINFMYSNKSDEQIWNEFKKRIDIHDKYRNENYYKTFPEFGELIKAK